jgi:carbon storage regulator CsrA
MLVLSRKPGEVLKIGDNIEVTVVKASKNEVRLGITAPKDVRVVRTDAKVQERKADQ